MEEDYSYIHKNINDIKSKIGDVRLMVVSKTRDKDEIEAAIRAGAKIFGENRLQEVKEKWAELRRKFPKVKLYFIGSLQTNKMKDIISLFDGIMSIDSEKHIDILKNSQKEIALYIQINIGSEPQKSGVSVDDFPKLLEYARNNKVDIRGAMCIPPAGLDPSSFFIQMKQIALENGIKNVSMGMSEDYEIAAKLGSNMVRVGSTVFRK